MAAQPGASVQPVDCRAGATGPGGFLAMCPHPFLTEKARDFKNNRKGKIKEVQELFMVLTPAGSLVPTHGPLKGRHGNGGRKGTRASEKTDFIWRISAAGGWRWGWESMRQPPGPHHGAVPDWPLMVGAGDGKGMA